MVRIYVRVEENEASGASAHLHTLTFPSQQDSGGIGQIAEHSFQQNSGLEEQTTEMNLENPSSNSNEKSAKKSTRAIPNACEKHRKEHNKCSLDCPFRVQ